MHLKFWQKAYLLTLALFIAAFGGGIALLSQWSQQRSFEAECGKLLAQQHAVAQSFVRDAAAVQARRPTALPRLTQNYAAQQSALLLQIRQGDTVWADRIPQPEEALPPAPPVGERVHTVRLAEGRHTLYVLAQLPQPEEVVLTCAFDMEPFFRQWAQTRRLFWGTGAAVLAALAAALYFVLRGLSRPMERLAAMTEKLAQGDYTARSPIRSRDEVGQLAHALNDLAAQVQQNVAQLQAEARQKQQLVDDLAHELRTPLTAVGGYAEYLQRARVDEAETYEVTSYLINETRRLTALSERLLQMAALRGETARREPVAVNQLLEAVRRTVLPKAREKKVRLQVVKEGSGTVRGEAPLLESLLVNLADNAIKACSPGGLVTLGTAPAPEGIRVWVRDTGCGMDAQTMAQLGQPFFRPDKARSRQQGGAGLGLSLCFAIAQAHGATLTFSSAPGAGTTAEILFTTL